MAPHRTVTADSLDPHVTFRHVEIDELRPALSLLLTGRISENELSVEHFLQFAARQDMSLDETWGAFRGNDLLAVCLLIESAGRAGILFLSPPGAPGNPGASGVSSAERTGLVQRLLSEQPAGRLHLVQALVDPDHQADVRMLEAASFKALATLVYMQRSIRRADQRAKLELQADESHLKLTTWSEAARPLFERAILRSYEQTQDCPGLLGMREIGDIIAGHMSSGEFDPSLWHVLHAGDEPAGVMLLSRTPPNDAAELVYLGLSPSWRGRRLGSRLLNWGIGQARAAGAVQMLLAVDDANAPALAMYRAAQFVATGKKIAMIRSLR